MVFMAEVLKEKLMQNMRECEGAKMVNKAIKVDRECKVAVLVLGMHRSGTSLLGGVLEQLGCRGAKTRMAANQWNAKGYFESPEVMKLNDAILDALGSRWDDWSPLHPGWQESPRFNEFRGRIAEVMDAEYGGASLVYVKDPRICRLLPLWREALEDAGYAPVCIHIHRNPADVACSLQLRTSAQVAPGVGMLLWLQHVLDAEAGSRGLPRIFTSYARVLSNWTEFSDRAEQSFGFSWPVMKQAREARVREILDSALRHHDMPVSAFLANSSAPDLARDCLRILEDWADKGEDDAGREALALIRNRFDDAGTLFAQPLIELSIHRQRASMLETERAATQGTAKAHEAEAAKLRREMEDHRQQAEEVQQTLRGEVHELAKLLAAKETDLEVLTRQRDEFQRQGDNLQEELQLAKARLTQHSAEVDIRLVEWQEKFNVASASLTQMHLRFDALQKERDILFEQASSLREELTQASDRVATIRTEAEAQEDRLQAELNAFADKIIERDQTAAALRKELDQANGRATAIRAEADVQQARLQAELNAFADKIIERDKTAATLRNEIDKLHQAYRSSTSWRYSAPIRAVGQLLKGKKYHAP